MLTTSEKAVMIEGPLKRICIATGRMNEKTFQAVIDANTNKDGTINWQGVIAFLNAIMADLPQILQILALFGL